MWIRDLGWTVPPHYHTHDWLRRGALLRMKEGKGVNDRLASPHGFCEELYMSKKYLRFNEIPQKFRSSA